MVRSSTKKVGPSRFAQKRGVAAVFVAGAISLLIAFVAFVLGISSMMNAKTKLDSIAASVALAALDGANRSVGSATEKAEVAELRAQQVLAQHGFSAEGHGSFATLTFGNGLEKGMWYQEAPPSPPVSCGGVFPCFETLAANAASFNAVRATLDSAITGGSSFKLPFAGAAFGKAGWDLSGSSIATLTPRCVAFVLDGSSSVMGENYRTLSTQEWNALRADMTLEGVNPYDANNIYLRRGDFLRTQSDFEAIVGPGYNPALCPNDALAAPNRNVLPSTHYLRYFSGICRPLGEDSPYRHYADDYELVSLADNGGVPQRAYVDKYLSTYVNPVTNEPFYGPEPFTTYMRSFNAGIQKLKEQAVPGDVAGIIAFRRSIVSATGLSSNLDHLLQITNVTARGTIGVTNAEVRPNMLDWGFFPAPGGSQQDASNIIIGLEEAMRQLSDTNFCPSYAKKIIVLATDGIPNCFSTAGTYGPYVPDSSGNSERTITVSLPNNTTPTATFNFNVPANCYSINPNTLVSQVNNRVTPDSRPSTADYCNVSSAGADDVYAPRCIAMRDCFDYSTVALTASVPPYICSGTFGAYLNAEVQMGRWDGGQRDFGFGGNNKGLIQMLSEAEISVSVILKADYVMPNFLNVKKPGSSTEFYDPYAAGLAGFDGLPSNNSDSPTPFFAWTTHGWTGSTNLGYAHPSAGYAWANNLSVSNDARNFLSPTAESPFLRANGLMGELALKTLGRWCPIMPKAASGYTDHDGDDATCAVPGKTPCQLTTATARASRGAGDFPLTFNEPGCSIGAREWGYLGDPTATPPSCTVVKSIEDRNSVQQALDCVKRSLGSNPYSLVEP